MNAGTRNTYEQITALVESYGWRDVLTAVELVIDDYASNTPGCRLRPSEKARQNIALAKCAMLRAVKPVSES